MMRFKLTRNQREKLIILIASHSPVIFTHHFKRDAIDLSSNDESQGKGKTFHDEAFIVRLRAL